MADLIGPPIDDEEELEDVIAAELSKNDDIVDYIQVNSLESLKARFGAAEEDENIRNEGFELAKKGGLIRKPKPESAAVPYGAEFLTPSRDIQTEAETELAKVFDETKSEYDNTTVEFADLDLNKPTQEPVKEPEKADEKKEEQPQESPKRKRGRPRKNPLPEEVKKEEPPRAEEPKDDEEEIQTVKKYNTHTKVLFVDESIDDGIKRNSDEELEDLFGNRPSERRRKPWFPRKK